MKIHHLLRLMMLSQSSLQLYGWSVSNEMQSDWGSSMEKHLLFAKSATIYDGWIRTVSKYDELYTWPVNFFRLCHVTTPNVTVFWWDFKIKIKKSVNQYPIKPFFFSEKNPAVVMSHPTFAPPEIESWANSSLQCSSSSVRPILASVAKSCHVFLIRFRRILTDEYALI